MKKKAIIIEDEGKDYDLIKNGIQESKIDFEIISFDLNTLIKGLKTNDDDLIFNTIQNNVDLFIIDASLEKGQDELGLKFLLKLKENYKTEFKYIVTSIWDKAEFIAKIEIGVDEFINKNNFRGFEFRIEVRNKINRLWKN